ncbi:hypothetical protein DY000_02011642 [Brassica cretica]|uniref:Uncharacterized protein n=1 Tax=Brassica cretica TaxID=69181 RepID=A0ABQ7D6P4_BRACR|nr:hypothetical protein DY000_02011642 [Brassica cretica]
MEQEQVRTTSSTLNHTKKFTTSFHLRLNSFWDSYHVTSQFQLLVPLKNTMILVYLVVIDLLREKLLKVIMNSFLFSFNYFSIFYIV